MNTKSFQECGINSSNLPNSEVIFVGLSYKLNKDGKILEAFCNSTNSGKIIHQLEDECSGISIYKTNLVKGVPLSNSKIRYPDLNEKKEGLSILLAEIGEINPKVVCLFGKQVSDFVIKNLDLIKISDLEYRLGKITFILEYHPSYIYVYKRKEIGAYISSIISKIHKIIGNKKNSI